MPVDGNGFINAQDTTNGIIITGTSSDSIAANLVGQAVAVTLNGATYSTTIKSDGTWSVNVAAGDLAALVDGIGYTVTASATDLAGNTAEGTTTVTVDRTAPAVMEQLADDTGLSSSDNNTSDPTLTGSGDPNAIVHFTVDGIALASTITADGNGNWTYTPSGLADGSHTIVASETDAAGNTGAASLTFMLDTTPPVLDGHYLLLNPDTGLSTGGGVTVDVNTFILAGFILDSSPSTHIQVFATKSGSGTPVSIGSGVADAGGNFSIPTNALSDGTYTFSVTATDLAGNATTEIGPYAVTIATIVPTVTEALLNDTGASSSDNITSDPTLTGSGDPNATVHFTVDGTALATTVTADGTGNWRFTPSGLADGSHTVVASETNAVGNTGTASLTFTLDTVASATINPLTSDDIINANEASTGFVISGTTNANRILAAITDASGHDIAGLSLATISNGTWSYPSWYIQQYVSHLADGTYKFVIYNDYDAAGNLIMRCCGKRHDRIAKFYRGSDASGRNGASCGRYRSVVQR